MNLYRVNRFDSLLLEEARIDYSEGQEGVHVGIVQTPGS
jgi:hypothetical protein